MSIELRAINHKKYTRAQRLVNDEMYRLLSHQHKAGKINYTIDSVNEDDVGKYISMNEIDGTLELKFKYGTVRIVGRGRRGIDDIKSELIHIFNIMPNFNIIKPQPALSIDDIRVNNNYLIKCHDSVKPGGLRRIVTGEDYIATCIDKTNVATFEIMYKNRRSQTDAHNVYNWIYEPRKTIEIDPLSDNGCTIFMLPDLGNEISKTNSPNQVTEAALARKAERTRTSSAMFVESVKNFPYTSNDKTVNKALKTFFVPRFAKHIRSFLKTSSKGGKKNSRKRKTKKLK